MQRVQKSILWAVIVSETSHVFCCVLPTVFSLIGLASGLGFIVTMPPWLEAVHERLHAYELPMIGVSAAVMALGWVLYGISRRMDCHDTGCAHGPCAPSKKGVHLVLIGATALFAFNLFVYFTFHAHAH